MVERGRATSPGAAGRGEITARGVWREAWSIVRRYPVATILPALVLGSLVQGLTLLGESEVVDETLSNLAGAFVYYLYLAYVEDLVGNIRSGAGVPSFRRLLPVASVALRLVVASFLVIGFVVAALVVAALATVGAEGMGVGDPVILVILVVMAVPFLLVLTSLSLFAPALSSEGLGPVAALIRSSRLARGHLWLVFWTATLAFLLEEIADEPVGLIGDSLGEYGEWIAGSIVTALIMPVAAVATSLAYHRILRLERQG